MIYAWDKTIITTPADEGRILEAAEQICDGVRIKASRYVPEGTAYFFDDEALDALLSSDPMVIVSRPYPRDDYLGWRPFDPRSVMKITDITAS